MGAERGFVIRQPCHRTLSCFEFCCCPYDSSSLSSICLGDLTPLLLLSTELLNPIEPRRLLATFCLLWNERAITAVLLQQILSHRRFTAHNFVAVVSERTSQRIRYALHRVE